MLARDMREAGDYAGSVDLLEDTYERYRGVLGEDFVDTLRTGKSLAVSLRKVGRLDEAYVLTKEIDGRYERSYAANHPDALACKLNLACDLSARDDKKAAFETASRCSSLTSPPSAGRTRSRSWPRTTSPPTCAASAR